MNLSKEFLAAVPQCMPLVALLTWRKFIREPHLSGVVTITHFVHDDVIMFKCTLINFPWEEIRRRAGKFSFFLILFFRFHHASYQSILALLHFFSQLQVFL